MSESVQWKVSQYLFENHFITVNHSFPSVSEILQPTTLTHENELKPIDKNKQLKVGVGKAMSMMATVL